MHELSLSLNILDLVDKSAGEGNAGKVHEVNIEVGGLSGVDGGILEEALRMVSSKTTLFTVRLLAPVKNAVRDSRCRIFGMPVLPADRGQLKLLRGETWKWSPSSCQIDLKR
jgi:Zn finger protein HypA/HybF involved in hydrogenase expression